MLPPVTARTVTSWLAELAAQRGRATAVVTPGGVELTFADLERRSARLAGGLRALGVRPGDRVGVFLPNGTAGIEFFFAIARLGAVAIGVNTRYRADDLRHLLEVSEAQVLVSAVDFLGIDFEGIVADATATMAAPPHVVWPDERRVLATHAPHEPDDARPDDLVVAFTTSGTTGRPKLAAHDHASLVRHIGIAARSFGVEPDDTGLLAVPLCGTFGLISVLTMFAGGARVVVPDRFEAATAAALMAEHRVTHLNASDDMLIGLIDAAAGLDLSAWREGVFAEFTNQGRAAVDAGDTVGARLTGVYGSSETYAFLAHRLTSEPAGARARNGGTLVDEAMAVRTADPVTGDVMAPGEQGELQFSGPSVLREHLGNPDATGKAFTADGWMRTGDVGICDPDGRSFQYLARLGDALRLAGFLTDPVEIERRLLLHPGVSAAQVVGVAGPGGGDVAVAFVVAGEDAPTESELIAHCAAALANYKVPRRVVLVASFPTVDGANGVKIRKSELRDMARDVIVE
jgi:fatty-acyl-CoA synthase